VSLIEYVHDDDVRDHRDDHDGLSDHDGHDDRGYCAFEMLRNFFVKPISFSLLFIHFYLHS
jgi:hypothetical protein